MAVVTLLKADLGLISSLATRRVEIPHLTSSTPNRTLNGSVVRFAGDVLPTPFRGEGGTRTWALSARYTQYQSTALKALLDLFEDAAVAVDSRLLLRTHYGQAAGLDRSTAVVVLEYSSVPSRGLLTDVSFTATAVNWSPEV